MVQEFLNSKFATFVLSGALIFVMVITAKILVQKRTIDREISKLVNQMEKINNDNQQLSSLIQYLNTPEYKEREAREKLNLHKDGEYVVVLPPGDTAGAETDQNQASDVKNYKLWFNYFFNHVE